MLSYLTLKKNLRMIQFLWVFKSYWLLLDIPYSFVRAGGHNVWDHSEAPFSPPPFFLPWTLDGFCLKGSCGGGRALEGPWTATSAIKKEVKSITGCLYFSSPLISNWTLQKALYLLLSARRGPIRPIKFSPIIAVTQRAFPGILGISFPCWVSRRPNRGFGT